MGLSPRVTTTYQTELYQTATCRILQDSTVDSIKYEATWAEEDGYVYCNGLMYTYDIFVKIMFRTTARAVSRAEWELMKRCIDEHRGVVLMTGSVTYEILVHHVRCSGSSIVDSRTVDLVCPPYAPEDEIQALAQTISNLDKARNTNQAACYAWALASFCAELAGRESQDTHGRTTNNVRDGTPSRNALIAMKAYEEAAVRFDTAGSRL